MQSSPVPQSLDQRGLHRPLQTPYKSARFLAAYDRLVLFAQASSVTVLLEGESGTGKTHLARQLHALSARAAETFESVNLAAIDDSLVGSELFGHVKGAFTGATERRRGLFLTAARGTLFLDEIGKASRAVQQRLLHVIEQGRMRPLGSDREVPVDVRIVAASNVPVELLVQRGDFLPDLCARIRHFRVAIPPLRERRADIPILVGECLARLAPECGYAVPPRVDDALLRALVAAPWPENVRELRSTVHRLLVDARCASVLTLDLCIDDLAHLRETGVRSGRKRALSADEARAAIASADDVSSAARRAGVHRATLYRAIQRGDADPENAQPSRDTDHPVAPPTLRQGVDERTVG